MPAIHNPRTDSNNPSGSSEENTSHRAHTPIPRNSQIAANPRQLDATMRGPRPFATTWGPR